VADVPERIRFEDLVFADEHGVLLPTIRPVMVRRSPYGVLHFQIDKVGNGQDLWITVRAPGQLVLGAGLNQPWEKLHPLLGSILKDKL
jgi:hypothetical protein